MLFSLSFPMMSLAGVLGYLDGHGTDYFDDIEFILRVYVVPSAITFAVGAAFWFTGRGRSLEDLELLEREGFAVVGLAWLLVAAFGAFPYMLAGELDPLDAYFESMSGFTTTGATMIGPDEVQGVLYHDVIFDRDIESRVYHHSTFVNASFTGIRLTDTYFHECTFINSSFDQVDLEDVWFINCTFITTSYNDRTIEIGSASPASLFRHGQVTDEDRDQWKQVYYPVPRSLLLWRSFTQWIGGMGIVVLTIVVLSRFMGSSIQLLKVELPGLTMARLKPKIAQTAALFWQIYAGFTLVLVSLLRLSGMPLYDAFGHAFTCLSSGGFSPRAWSIEAYDSVVFEAILITFMIIAGTNFVLHFHALHGDWTKLTGDREFRTFISIMLVATVIIMVKLTTAGIHSPLSSLRYAVFQVVSLNTATGYSSIGYGTWPESVRFLLVILMVIGGSAGSTSGGLKVIRLMVLMKIARREISRTIHPQREMPITIGDRALPEYLVQAVNTYFFVYLAILVLASTIVMFTGETMMDSLSTVATAMGGVGPPAGTAGPYFSFSAMHPLSKVVLILCMWLGRIEILAGFILFAPWSYKE